MTAFVLKLIACITMLLDHVGYVFGGDLVWLRLIGRVAFPLFAFLLAVGYDKTRNYLWYFVRVCLFAVVSQLPFYLLSHPAQLGGLSFSMFTDSFEYSMNVMCTFALGLLALLIFDRVSTSPVPAVKSKGMRSFYRVVFFILACALVLPLAYLADWRDMDYGLWGVLLIVAFYATRKSKPLTALVLVLYSLHNITPFLAGNLLLRLFYACNLLALVPLMLYNGKQGKLRLKYLFYAFYPAHMLLLVLIYNLIH